VEAGAEAAAPRPQKKKARRTLAKAPQEEEEQPPEVPEVPAEEGFLPLAADSSSSESEEDNHEGGGGADEHPTAAAGGSKEEPPGDGNPASASASASAAAAVDPAGSPALLVSTNASTKRATAGAAVPRYFGAARPSSPSATRAVDTVELQRRVDVDPTDEEAWVMLGLASLDAARGESDEEEAAARCDDALRAFSRALEVKEAFPPLTPKGKKVQKREKSKSRAAYD